MLDHVASLSCLRCGESFRPSRRARCPSCPDGGALRYSYRLEALQPFDKRTWSRRESWLYRFREVLPFDDTFEPPPLQIGMTPLYGSPRLARRCGVRGLYVKDESRSPTGRIADRAAALLTADALTSRQTLVTSALAKSVSAFASAAGLPVLALLAPGDEAGPAQAFGARTLSLAPGMDPAQALLQLQLNGFALGDRPHPLAFEGLKTLGLEIGEQLAERLPDWVVLDARLPDLVEAVVEGLAQCAALGFFERAPRVLAVDGAGGEAQVTSDDAARQALVDPARQALGLPLGAAGLGALAGLQRAVEQGVISPESLALVVVESPALVAPAHLRPSLAVPDYEVLRAAAESALHTED
jgi:threonine synthase